MPTFFATIAQATATPPALPGAPMLQHALLESPALAIVVLVAAGVAVLVAPRGAGRSRSAAIAGTALIVLGLAVGGVAWLVETDREAVTGATRDLVQATAGVDRAGMYRLLAEDCRLLAGAEVEGLRAPPAGFDKATIMLRVPEVLGTRYPVEDASVVECQAQVTGLDVARTQAHVRVTLKDWGVPHNSWWRLEWRREPAGWRAITITPLVVQGAR